ncbi:tetratricopeptide repeat-containing protein [Arenimonas caeni]|uniref:Tetratricopeptide repeat-containing protein n=2 Tax=Arenimonas caeni TaxID=2058085 RepID=A0A2P6M5P3_9GAMM|nr:tetratricopeptide repeat-containing protein [Arenimonas caeni]
MTNPDDFKTRSQLEWVTFDEIKRVVARIESALKDSQRASSQDLNFVMTRWEEYQQSQPRVPEMACSMIVGQIIKVAHLLPKFADIIYWLRLDGLRDEDWQPNEYQGKSYPSLATKIALALCKWIKSHPDTSTDEDVDMALEWIDATRKAATGDIPLWLNWNAAILFRKKGEFQRATELLTSVIKAKRNEFWVWAEAGRLYQSEQPELALACFCRALECPAESKFLVKAHRELAELLAELEEYAQASREVATTIDIRQAEGWPIGREMEALIASPWYDPSAEGAEDPKEFYGRHSPAALALCFDIVETKAASYLGLLIPHTPKDPRPGWKPKPLSRFAIKDAQGRSWSLVGPGIRKPKFETGAPLTVVIGRQDGDDRQTIVHASVRSDGEQWDCLERGTGVVVREAADGKPLKVFIAGSGDELGVDAPDGNVLRVGDGIKLGMTRNPKNDRLDAFNVERGELPDRDVKLVQGQLRRNPKGFAFIDDAFVAPALVDSIDSAIDEVMAVAVYGKHPKEDKRAWRVISLKPLT